MSRAIALLLFAICTCCSQENRSDGAKRRAYSTREIAEESLTLPPLSFKPLPKYPWDAGTSKHPTITKEFFRCNGSLMNPMKGELDDCGGPTTHSLPLKGEEEFIYPILIDLLNYLQEKTGCRAVITAGHRCPAHHFYARGEGQEKYSKHMMGAEVAFYMQGMENKIGDLIPLIQEYFKNEPEEYAKFLRYAKDDTDVSTQPWYNREIFVKLYTAQEGRDLDNRHPYPFLRIQVRFDRATGEKVSFNWDVASKNFLRF